MRDANTVGSDGYYHCRANCEASRRGPVGEGVAEELSDLREATDMVKETVLDTFTREEAAAHSAQDQAANRQGRDGARGNASANCVRVCETRRPDALPNRH